MIKREETTVMYPEMAAKGYRYFETGHVCGIKVRVENAARRILCDCSVSYLRVDPGEVI